MQKNKKSNKLNNFHWEDYIQGKSTKSKESKIQEFIVYQKPNQETNNYFIRKYDKTQEQNLEILNLIKEILTNTAKLSPQQIIDYCNSQRYFMKLYFKKLQKKRE
ncbi:MAG: hypothetical protein ACFFBH_10695 [Promethearchaeota archaeon]